MDRLIYTALTGMQRLEESQRVTAHNLANAGTPGFRREMAALSAGWVSGEGSAITTRVQAGGESPNDLLSQGRVDVTGHTLDVALNGGAWLSVADDNGQPALTRRGDLRLDPDGRLLTGDGRPVLGEDGPIRIAAGHHSLRVGPDGRVEVKGTDDQPYVPVARLRLVSPDPMTMERGSDGLFRADDMAADPLATVTSGALERSNVETTASLVELIEQSRTFEMQTKLLTAAREMDEGTAALMRVE